MKKLFMTILVLASVLLMPNFAPICSTLSQPTATYKVTSADILAPPSLFPTNATFETKAEVVGNKSILNVGGTGADYYAQSYKALSDYIVNAGLSIREYTGTTPDFRIYLCNSTPSGYANVQEPMANSTVIPGSMLTSTPKRFYLNLTTPVRVQQNETYWLVLGGYDDEAVAGAGGSSYRNGDPYPEGFFCFSFNNGTSWSSPSDQDLDFVVNFSNRPNKAEVIGTSNVWPVGGTTGSDYYAQSFKALDSYIVDAGVWIAHNTGVTPDFYVQIWGNTASDYPDKNNVLANSTVIRGSEVDASPGRFFVHPNVSIPVVVGETYWLVIDGYLDNATAGSGKSLGSLDDTYKDGQFMYSNSAGSDWSTWSAKDLNFIVTFSAQQSAIMVDGDLEQQGIGGNGTYRYFGQRFKALGKYILDASVWLSNYTNNCPDVRILLCPRKTVGSDPNVTSPTAISLKIEGAQIMSQPGLFYLSPTKPVEVVPGETYYLMIDGWTYHTSANASVMTRYQTVSPNGPYTDGRRYYTTDGTTWWWSYTIDMDMDIRFSDVPYKAQCGQDMNVTAVGGVDGSDYYAQSFVALNDYIADVGVWMKSDSIFAPDFRILLCRNSADHPNVTDVIAMSMVIDGSAVKGSPGIFCVKPITPIPVEIGQTYWVVIDGYYDHVTDGYAYSRGTDFDAYPNGEFKFSNDAGVTWNTYTARDLEFEVVFTHVNQPPTQPDVTISPLKPLDSDDLTVQFPIPSADFEDEPVLYYVEWYKNGIPQPAWANNIVVLESATLQTEDWMATVTPYDGHINGTSASYTVHVQADILTIDHEVTADSQTFHVITKSNTTITGFDFHHTVKDAPANITFTSTGISGTEGFCNITIPKTLVNVYNPSQWMIIVNGTLFTTKAIITENATHTFIYLNYTTSSVPIVIQGLYAVPEFAPAMLLITLALTTLAVAVVGKKINKRKR